MAFDGYHADDHAYTRQYYAPTRPLSRQPSQESIRTELCDGPLLQDADATPKVGVEAVEMEMEMEVEVEVPGKAVSGVTDRAELIERLKRGESPTWVPSRHVSFLLWSNERFIATSTGHR
jgi:hypothetical protein